MIFIGICVGSSCHLKGSQQLVELFQHKIKEKFLDDEIVLSGNFCLGKCNREGVTITIGDGDNDEVFTGITPEKFSQFWTDQIETRL